MNTPPDTPTGSRACSLSRRRLLLATSALAAIGGAAAQPAAAWPRQALRIIVPFGPGGPADLSARALGEALAPALGQGVVVENRPGGGSAVGVMAAAQARDGHTLLMGSNSMVINPILNSSLSYDVERDFDALAMVSAQPLVLVVPATSRIQSIHDLVAEAKASPPGALAAGNSGNATLAHLTAELFAMQAGVSITSVSYKGEAALMPDLIAGRVAFGFLNLPTLLPHLRAGRLRALAVSQAQEHPDLPGVAPLRSLGFAQLEVQGWAALLAPKGSIPADGLAQLEALLARSLASDAVVSRFATLGVAPVPSTRASTAQTLKAEATRWQQVIRARGIKLEG